MSAFGKVYLAVTTGLVLVGTVAAVATVRDNASWVEAAVWMPALDGVELFRRRRYEINLGALLGGWALVGLALAVFAIRAPFWVRSAARRRRRIRELEREVLELRTLPLRQEAEDELLAAEAHLDAGSTRVMTQKIDLERRGAGDSRAEIAPWMR